MMDQKRRLRLTNGRLALDLDCLTGQLLAFTDLARQENLIKNHLFSLPQPLAVRSGKDLLFPGDARAVASFPQLRPEINPSSTGLAATIRYSALWDGTRPRSFEATILILLSEDRAESSWCLRLVCGPGETADWVRFPCLNGIYLGETWEDDTLVYPHYAGIKIHDPVTAFARKPSDICWRWQDYEYTYRTGEGSLAQELPEGGYGMEGRYTGTLSMKWLDYYDGGRGLSFSCYDPAFSSLGLRAETFGPHSPGMSFSFTFPVELNPGDIWNSPEVSACVHEGDWHTAASLYRARHRGLPADTAAPEWFRKSPGLAAHYDFKYQTGEIIHRYGDIGKLWDQAQSMGLNHLLLAGWHQDGFDRGFPEYTSDKDLGTEDELKQELANLRAKGGHVSLYMNTRIINLNYEHHRDFVEQNAVRQKDGGVLTERAGGLEFAVQCIGSAPWREKLRQSAAYILRSVGGDGVYLDQLAMGEPGPCHDPAHGHQADQWNIFYRQLLQEILQNEKDEDKKSALLIEGCSDSYGDLCAGQLVSTFAYHHRGAFPALYRYTFPEQILIDMLYPQAGLLMRPVHLAQVSRQLMDRAFVLGLYPWVYDLEGENSFFDDPDSLALLKEMLSLRRFWLERFGLGTFRDQEQILSTPPGLLLSSYQTGSGMLLAAANSTGQGTWVELTFPKIKNAWSYCAGELPEGQPCALLRPGGEAVRLSIPSNPYSLVWIQ